MSKKVDIRIKGCPEAINETIEKFQSVEKLVNPDGRVLSKDKIIISWLLEYLPSIKKSIQNKINKFYE